MGNELKDETLCDIIAEKRRSAEHIRNNLSTVPVRQWDQEAEIKSLEEEADRLDRARMKMEIEMANLRKENAKLSEAIVHMIDTADSIAIREPTGVIGKLAFHIKHTGESALAATDKEGGNDGNE